MSIQSLAQRRARHALELIQKHEKAGRDSYKNYVSYAESIPATIVMNGLGQACATLLAKAKGDLTQPHGLLYSDLQSWLCGPESPTRFKGKSDLMDAIVHSDQADYLQAQTEAIAFLVWLKKLASAYLQPGKPE